MFSYMRLHFRNYFVLSLIILLSSCVSRKKMVYFQGSENESGEKAITLPTSIIMSGDLVSITVSSVNMEATVPFNLPMVTPNIANGKSTGSMQQPTYLVDEEGFIDFPVLGKLAVAGLPRKEVTALIKEKLQGYLKDPVVNIRIQNFKISVLGEVMRPGVFTVGNEKITLLEALALAGDISIMANRKNVLVIRNVDGKNVQTRIDLTSNQVFSSEVYFLKQNDVIYVEPNKAKINSSATGTNTSLYVAITSMVLTLTVLLLR